jgi:hypothetical protein
MWLMDYAGKADEEQKGESPSIFIYSAFVQILNDQE